MTEWVCKTCAFRHAAFNSLDSHHAGIAQWQSAGLPVRLRGFDSRCPFQFRSEAIMAEHKGFVIT